VRVLDAATTYTETNPSGLEPPAGKVPPDSALFEKAWRYENLWAGPAVREALGWALAPAQHFQGVSQHPWETKFVVDENGGIVNASGPYSPFQYLRLSDGRTAFLSLYIGHGAQPYWVHLP
jgi:hypothetical protein